MSAEAVQAALVARDAAEAEARALCAILSKREREELILLAKGCNQREVASQFGISLGTLGYDLQRIWATLDVESTIEAAVVATKAGVV